MHPLTMSSYTKRLRGTYSPRKKEARFSTAFENDTKSLHLRNFARREASCVYLQKNVQIITRYLFGQVSHATSCLRNFDHSHFS